MPQYASLLISIKRQADKTQLWWRSCTHSPRRSCPLTMLVRNPLPGLPKAEHEDYQRSALSPWKRRHKSSPCPAFRQAEPVSPAKLNDKLLEDRENLSYIFCHFQGQNSLSKSHETAVLFGVLIWSTEFSRPNTGSYSSSPTPVTSKLKRKEEIVETSDEETFNFHS